MVDRGRWNRGTGGQRDSWTEGGGKRGDRGMGGQRERGQRDREIEGWWTKGGGTGRQRDSGTEGCLDRGRGTEGWVDRWRGDRGTVFTLPSHQLNHSEQALACLHPVDPLASPHQESYMSQRTRPQQPPGPQDLTLGHCGPQEPSLRVFCKGCDAFMTS